MAAGTLLRKLCFSAADLLDFRWQHFHRSRRRLTRHCDQTFGLKLVR